MYSYENRKNVLDSIWLKPKYLFKMGNQQVKILLSI